MYKKRKKNIFKHKKANMEVIGYFNCIVLVLQQNTFSVHIQICRSDKYIILLLVCFVNNLLQYLILPIGNCLNFKQHLNRQKIYMSAFQAKSFYKNSCTFYEELLLQVLSESHSNTSFIGIKKKKKFCIFLNFVKLWYCRQLF